MEVVEACTQLPLEAVRGATVAGQGLQAVEVAGSPAVVEAGCLPPGPSVQSVPVQVAVGLVVVEAGCLPPSMTCCVRGVTVEEEVGLVVVGADHLT